MLVGDASAQRARNAAARVERDKERAAKAATRALIQQEMAAAQVEAGGGAYPSRERTARAHLPPRWLLGHVYLPKPLCVAMFMRLRSCAALSCRCTAFHVGAARVGMIAHSALKLHGTTPLLPCVAASRACAAQHVGQRQRGG
jgi:hypothetical protein